jgi:hypothetical protein
MSGDIWSNGKMPRSLSSKTLTQPRKITKRELKRRTYDGPYDFRASHGKEEIMLN